MTVRQAVATALLIGVVAVAAVVMVAGGVGAQEDGGGLDRRALRAYAGAQVRAACTLYESLGGSCTAVEGDGGVTGVPLVKRDVGNVVLGDGNIDGTGQFIPAAMREFRDTGAVTMLRGALDRYIAWEGAKYGLSIRQFRVSSEIECSFEGDETRIKCMWGIVDDEGRATRTGVTMSVAVLSEIGRDWATANGVRWTVETATSTTSGTGQ